MIQRDLMTLIHEARAGVDYGIVNLALKIHDGELTTVDTSKWSSIKTPKGNTEALANVTNLIKGVVTNKESGSLTFVITFEKGNAVRMQVQDSKRIT